MKKIVPEPIRMAEMPSYELGAKKPAIQSIEVVTPALPPVHDAIGEYTEKLALALAGLVGVRLLTGDQSTVETDLTLSVVQAFSLGSQGLRRLKERLLTTTADAVVLQYNPFGWGKRGWAPSLVGAAKAFKRERPDVVLAVMFHETYMMNPGWKSWCMRRYQAPQFHRMAEAADVCFFSTEVWAEQERKRRPQADIVHLPVGSNLPRSVADVNTTRHRLGIPDDAFVVGLFGGSHPSRRFDWIRAGIDQIAARLTDRPVVGLHVGGRGDELPSGNAPVITTGRVSAVDAADAIAAMDVMLNPFTDGVSTRRGSAIAALQQGTPLVTTCGRTTGRLWKDDACEGVYLADRPDEPCWSAAIAVCIADLCGAPSLARAAAIRLYEENFSWPGIANKLLDGLSREAASPHAL